jgi:hypothetical protein
MGSRPRNSSSAGSARSEKSEVRPAPRRQPDPAEVLDMLNGVRSIFACAADCLDDMVQPYDIAAPGQCGPQDAEVVVRLGIQKLDEVHEALDLGIRVVP